MKERNGVMTRLRALSIGEGLTFPLEDYGTVRSTASMLKKIYGAVFTTEKRKDCVYIMRVEPPKNEDITEAMLRRNGFRPTAGGSYELQQESFRLSYRLKRKVLVFEFWRYGKKRYKEYGVVEIKTLNAFQWFLDLLGIDLKLKY